MEIKKLLSIIEEKIKEANHESWFEDDATKHDLFSFIYQGKKYIIKREVYINGPSIPPEIKIKIQSVKRFLIFTTFDTIALIYGSDLSHNELSFIEKLVDCERCNRECFNDALEKNGRLNNLKQVA